MDIDAAMQCLNDAISERHLDSIEDIACNIAVWINKGGYLPSVKMVTLPDGLPDDIRQMLVKLSWKLTT